MPTHYEAIVIGAGQAGPSLAARLAGAGKRTAIIERHRFGGTCVNTGCTPTKTMVASARVAHVTRRAADFGVMIDASIQVDMKKVKARKDAIVEQSSTGVEKWLRSTDNLTVYEGHARFENPRTIRVGDDLLEAEQIFLDVGARARVPSGFEEVPYLTNSSIMDVDFLPEHLVIVGGGYIGLEFGQMFRRFGSRVTIVDRGSRLLRREDEDVSTAIREILETEGVDLRLDAECLSGRNSGDHVTVQLDCRHGDRQVKGSHVLIAAGRQPNTDDLGLEEAGVETDDRGFIKVDDKLCTSVPGIHAVGECNGRGAFTHTSYNDYEIVAANLLEGESRRVTDRITCYALYIDPPLGRVGMTESEVRESGRKALIGTRAMQRVSRAREKGETQGFMKALVDAESGEILGASILGVGGDEVVHSLIDVMHAGAPYTVIQRAVHVHPTVSELIPTMLGDLKPL